ncbi:MAG: YjbH domain-containing protein [Massilibacteroides sp.]|nr:YjbH domain-containing protein [Massilibacteroides sp.]MDD3061809.1 YjbH domain-containing protein [Massilibacteroides sp.]MDD4115410.1 YjbH domain-containing protein [Massilibacteroides sp.]MDD4660091.1 YjbH domain-containing protein [Massilibacteroides sp.]
MRSIFLLLVGCFSFSFAYGQKTKTEQAVSMSLIQMGMENIAVVEEPEVLHLSFDAPVYRNNYQGLFEVICMFLEKNDSNRNIQILLMEEQMPRLVVQIPESAIRAYRNRQLSLEGVMQTLTVRHETKADQSVFKNRKRENSSFGKIDLVLYPQISLNNAWMDKLYGAIVNIAPAIEVGLWKGASFTGQVIFPIWNNMKGEMDYIRPGMLVFRQQADLVSRLQTTFSIGNFNGSRMGADIDFRYRPVQGHWMIGARGGLTGASTFHEGKWEVAYWKHFFGSAYAEYYLPYYNLDIRLAANRYIYGDYGARMDITRHFGEVAVGVYAMHTGGEYNGGFHFAIPLFPEKRKKRGTIQIRLPRYFDWEYEAQSGNEYVAKRLGRDYETRPDENRSQFYYNPAYIKSALIQLSRK